jgi:nucleoid DNA-binding protein
MAKPTVKQVGTRHEFYWEKEHVYAVVSRLHEHTDGRVTAEIILKTDKTDAKTHILQTQLNLLSARSKKDLIRELHDRYPLTEEQWTEMVEQLCTMTLENHRTGKPATEVWPVPEGEPIPEPDMLIKPLIYQNKPTLIFGEGSAGKSYLALTMAILVQLPFKDNPLWLNPKQTHTLYLDYESDEADFRRRLTLLQRGFGLPEFPIMYRECELPLMEDIDHLEQIIAEYNIGFVVIDSLGVAAGGTDLNNAATATAFYSALRRLKVTSFIITHTSKDETKKSTAFGSVYFTNLARSVFAVKKHQEQEANEIAIDLVHVKNNQGPLLAHQGFKIEFHPDRTKVSRIEPETVPEFLEKMSLKTKIAHLLKEEGKMSPKDIAEVLDMSEATVRATLYRYKNIFIKVGKQWGLKLETSGL